MTRFVVMAWTLLLLPTAMAQAESDALQRAREAYTQGQVLYQQRRFADAAAKFEEAHALSPRAGNLFNIGRCYSELHQVPKALRAFREYLRLVPDAKEKAEVTAAIGRLETQLAQQGLQQVAVRAEPEGKARVRVDDRDLGLAPVVVELPKGTHTLEVSAEGFSTARQELTVSLDHAFDVSVSLERLAGALFVEDWKPPPTPPPAVDLTPPPPAVGTSAVPAQRQVQRRPYVGAWVTVGLAVAALSAAVVLGPVLERQTEADMRALVGGYAATRDLAARATALALGANIAFGVGGAAALASIFLFIFEGR